MTFAPSVFVHADELFAAHPNARAHICAIDCRTLTAKDDKGDLGQQLEVDATDERPPIDLTATVTISQGRPIVSTLEVHLTKKVTTGVCGSTEYLTDIHLDREGNLKPGRS